MASHRGNPVSIPVSMSCDIVSLKITKRLLFVMGRGGGIVFVVWNELNGYIRRISG